MLPDSNLEQVWVYLSASPLFGLTMTLIAYGIAYRVYVWSKANPLLNPVVTAVILLIALLVLTDTPYQDYFEGGQFVHFLLGPATVALAIPLYRQLGKLKMLWLPVLVALLVGVTVGGVSAVGIAWLLGADTPILLSLAPKSVTAPVAMGIAERIGGIPSLTAVLVVMTGVIGAVLGTKLFDVLRIRDCSARGIAMGVAAHGIGTARAFQVSTEMGAFAGLAMALSALLASVILPWLLGWMR
ncbi:TIGR00659 family protein [Thiothrix caldifontis]|uniref:TIGR00659 family protein n=1 Tax=Thiothrix caldifontis TaxID=525918 RepID=A0A1H4FW16_9GAMM|nr:LrgB family protein [Thiothrix caldifontis]SEB00702.1 TIGR00659 family protein [Thiothrix caldifontis]